MTVTDNLPAAAEPSDSNTDPYRALRQQQMDASLALRELLLQDGLPVLNWHIENVPQRYPDEISEGFVALSAQVYASGPHAGAVVESKLKQWARFLGVAIVVDPPNEHHPWTKLRLWADRGGVLIEIWGHVHPEPPAADR